MPYSLYPYVLLKYELSSTYFVLLVKTDTLWIINW